MARLYAIGLVLAVACSLLATAQGRAVTDMPANFTSAQANAALAHVLQHPSEVQDWLEKVKLPNLVQLKNWVSAFPPASAAQPLAAPPQQGPNGQGPPNNGQGPPNNGQGPPGQVQSFAQQQPAQAQPDAQPQAQAEQGPPQPQGAPQDAGPQGPPQNAGPQGPPGTAAQPAEAARTEAAPERRQRGDSGLGDVLGPIGLTLGGQLKPEASAAPAVEEEAAGAGQPARSIHGMSTDEWRRQYAPDGYVDLWVEEEFNAGSRVVGGRDAHKGAAAGAGSGEGPGASSAARHRVKIFNRHADQEVEVDVPEDRYILWEAEERGLLLPYACRMGCCTACAVRVLAGELHQPQSLGVSRELREAGYALMCVGFPRSDLVLETVAEDEVYDLQFGRSFAEQAVDPRTGSVERDDFALEIANMDE